MSSIKYRHLGRNSAHRQALLRNLVTSLIEKESISTTWAKAKEAQRLAEKLITLGKKNTNAARQKAQAIFYVCFTCPSPSLLCATRAYVPI
jgi:large subunit ribosomal protein L17